MAKFEVGDQVHMPGVPFVVTVLEIGQCEYGDECPLGPETFRYADPESGADDWEHTSKFEKVEG